MKRKFSKILGVGLTLALLASFLVMAAPVMAATAITDLSISVSDTTISTGAEYTITFDATNAVPLDGTITVAFPLGTPTPTFADDDITVQSTAGFGVLNLVEGISATNITVTAATSTAGPIVEITITAGDDLVAIGEAAMVRVKFLGTVISNPPTVDTYTLTVKTSADTTAVPVTYTTTVPDIGVLPGIVQQYNSTGILMAQETGDDAIYDMLATAQDNYTIVVGPGTYIMDTGKRLVITQEGLTLESSAGAVDTTIDLIDADRPAIHIQADDVIFDGFTLDDSPNDVVWIKQGADDVTIQNNIFVDGGPGIVLEGEDGGTVVTGATIADNVFEDSFTAIVILKGAKDNTISGNTITGCTDTATAITLQGGVTAYATTGNIITGNTITGNAGSGIYIWEGTAGGEFLVDNVIEDNTISGNEGNGIIIASDLVEGELKGLEILHNNITDNDGDGILIAVTTWDLSNIIKFNTITGNGDDGIDIDNGTAEATFNWWGADGVSTEGTVTTAPILADTADAVFSATKIGTASSLDAKTAVGVKVSVANATAIDLISVAEYIANPEEDIAGATGFYDVFVAGTLGDDATATIKFYAGDALTEVYIWSADTETWGAVTPVGFSVYGGYVYVTIDPAMLAGTPFALVGGEAEAATIDAPKIISPKGGARDIPLTPTFSWTQIADANGYYFQLADNANFVVPLVKLEGDLGRLIVTAYAYVAGLDYSSAYYWRVQAVKGTIDAGSLVASGWISGVFITMDEPEEVVPPIEIVEAPDLPDIILEQPDIIIESPDIIVPLPAETPITPSWIYVIIAVGGLLVISLIVLIVRTRRVA